MEYFEFAVPFLATTIAVLLAWFLVKKKQNALAMAQESAIKDNTSKEEEDCMDMEEVEENLAPYLLNSSELENLNADEQNKTWDVSKMQTYYKKSQLQLDKVEKTMTKEEIEEERNAQRKQLEDIFKMMEQNKDKFGVDSFQELEDQMKLYSK